ncbi:hypothetical protein EVAR_77171_1 [Eumeta japonica]|uniref:Uncharacterized protein n=1 Tax=Eumeta variegata TaxID=151549 RepID=A0A4C1T2W6_EUMVA|nr:hypothetical protein EVAR_77171_1 [Eumeta japonica]
MRKDYAFKLLSVGGADRVRARGARVGRAVGGRGRAPEWDEINDETGLEYDSNFETEQYVPRMPEDVLGKMQTATSTKA